MAGTYSRREISNSGIPRNQWYQANSIPSITHQEWDSIAVIEPPVAPSQVKDNKMDLGLDTGAAPAAAAKKIYCIHFSKLADQYQNERQKQDMERTPTVLGIPVLDPVVWDPTFDGSDNASGCIILAVPVDKDKQRAINTSLQYAVDWVNRGQSGLKHSQRHMCTYYMSALHSLTSRLYNNQLDPLDSKDEAKLWQNFALIAETARVYFNRFPESKQPLEALLTDVGATDMTQRCIALWFLRNDIPLKDLYYEHLYSCLEVMLLRWKKNVQPKDTLFTRAPKGMFVNMLILPRLITPLSAATNKTDTVQERVAAAYKDMEMIRSLKDDKDETATGGMVVQQILKFHNINLDSKFCCAFFNYATQPKKVMFDYATLGLMPNCKFLNRFDILEFFNAGKQISNPVRLFDVVHDAPNKDDGDKKDNKKDNKKKEEKEKMHVLVHSSSPAHWSAFSIKSDKLVSHYKIVGKPLAGADEAKGNTKGKNVTANIRITVGTEVFPRNLPGFSIAGIHYHPSTRTYEDTKKPMSMQTGLRVTNDATQQLVIIEDLATQHRVQLANASNLPLCIAFTYCTLEVSDAEPSNPPQNPKAKTDLGFVSSFQF
jgi:hypothetical protein